MTDRIHVTMNIDVFVEDETAMREAAFERMRAAWSSEDDFPFESADDVPLGQVVHSLLAGALPAELPGCRRSQLEVESDDADSSDDSDTDTPGSTTSDTSEAEEGSDDQDDESEASNDDESATEDTSNNDEPETEDTSDNDDASSGDDDKKDS
jgi:hypothetical protein